MPGGIHPPPEQWLLWPVPNYINPETKPRHVLIAACILAPLSTLLLFARLWVRVKIQKNHGWDDWLMLGSFFFALPTTVISVWGVERIRFDRHVYDIELRWFPIQRYYVLTQYILFTISTGLIKMSVLLFYRRLSSRSISPVFRCTLCAMIAMIAVHTIIFAVIPIFLCRPINAFWKQVDLLLVAKGYNYKCMNEGVEVVVNGILSTIQDFIAAALPSFLCWKLHISMRQKIGLYVIFAISYSTVAVGAIRTWYTYRIFFETYDFTWVAADLWLCSVLEINIGSMCANAPTLKAFYRHHFPHGLGAGLSGSAQDSNSKSTSKFFPSRPSPRLSRFSIFKKHSLSSNSHSGYFTSLNSTEETARNCDVEMSAGLGPEQHQMVNEPEHQDRSSGLWDEGRTPCSRVNTPAPGHDIQALPPFEIARPAKTFMFWKRWQNRGMIRYG